MFDDFDTSIQSDELASIVAMLFEGLEDEDLYSGLYGLILN